MKQASSSAVKRPYFGPARARLRLDILIVG
jgi:hypothetical protein